MALSRTHVRRYAYDSARSSVREVRIASLLAVAVSRSRSACDATAARSDAAQGVGARRPRRAEPQMAPASRRATRARRATAAASRALVEITWRRQCAACHGPIGHGDGPQGPMVKAADLTRDEWQAKVTDEEIAATIRSGKGRMPQVRPPGPVVKGLVAPHPVVPWANEANATASRSRSAPLSSRASARRAVFRLLAPRLAAKTKRVARRPRRPAPRVDRRVDAIRVAERRARARTREVSLRYPEERAARRLTTSRACPTATTS